MITDLLTIQDLHKSYGGPQHRAVLAGIQLAVKRGEYVAIMGESGAGKSTLLNLIAGLDVPDRGTIALDGVDLTSLDDDARTRIRRDLMGFVFQAFHLLPHLTVWQNVVLPLRIRREAVGTADERARALLEAVGLTDVAQRHPRALSGGEMQRAAIARALVHRPQLVLADEPTGNLDANSARRVLEVLREQIKTHAGAGILVTHSPAAAATTDRVFVLTSEGLIARAT